MRHIVLAVAVALAVALFTAIGAGSAAAQPAKYVYFTRFTTSPYERNLIIRQNSDGREPKVMAEITSPFEPTGFVVDGTYIYWANHGANTISREKLDGTGAILEFIKGASGPTQIAVDRSHIYWANNASGTIGRANLDGTGVNQTFIQVLHATPVGVAVNREHVYWTGSASLPAVGRANLDGSGKNENFITKISVVPGQIAVDDSHIYWVNEYDKAIGRANIDGTGVNQKFLAGPYGGLALDGEYLYLDFVAQEPPPERVTQVSKIRLDLTESGGVVPDAGPRFSMLAVSAEAPTAESKPASGLAQTGATLNGSVTPNGREVSECLFEYGTTTSYGSSAPCAQAPGSGVSPVAVSAALAGLVASTEYHFRISAANIGGVSKGSDETFKSPAKLTQSITFNSTPPGNATVGGPQYTVAAEASSKLAVSFSIDPSSSSVCTISGATVSFVGSGTCTIDANQAGNGEYEAAPQAQQSFQVAKKAQTSEFTSVPPANATVGGPQYTVAAEASSKLAVSFSIDPASSSVCTISGTTVSFVGSGTCTIDANQAGNGEYEAAPQVQQSFQVVPAAPPPTVTKLKPATGPVGGGTTVTISGTSFSGVTSVKFGATNATSFTLQTIKGVTSISAVAPAEPPGKVDVTVTTPGGTSAISTKDRFSFLPTVTGLSPTSGTSAGGTAVTVTGAGFALGKVATVLKFGTKKGTAVNCTSSTTCTVVSPAHEVGNVDVKATVNKVSSAKNAPADQFTYNLGGLVMEQTRTSELDLLGALARLPASTRTSPSSPMPSPL
jgi:hypothetical protein